MTRGRTCILCETVHVSKQEMDEHMRSMLHHRELEKLKGRDCGHECRVCKVTVMSLTDYASHISSPTHKQNVDAVEKRHAGNFQDEDYFDKALVELIEKRKQQIRKEKEAAAAKLAKEEKERKKKEAFQQRLKEAKERFQQERRCQQPPQGFGRPNSWYRGNQYNSRPDEPRLWHDSNPGRSATWHAQSPPNFRKWASGDFCERNTDTQQGWGNNPRHHGSFFGQSRMPWVSNGGSSNGLYGRNNISQYPQRNSPQGFYGSSSVCPPPPNFGSSSGSSNYFCSDAKQNTGNDHDQRGSGPQNQEYPEFGHNSSKNPKSFGSNPNLDKSSRWSPYPVAKDSHPKVSKSQKQETEPETSVLNGADNKPRELTSGEKSVEKKIPVKNNSKQIHGDSSSSSSSSGSRSSSAQRDQISSSGPSSLMANKPFLHKDKKSSSVPSLVSETQHCKTSSQVRPQPKAAKKPSGITAPLTGPLHTSQGQKLPETFKKEKAVLEKMSSLDSSGCKRSEMIPQTKEEQLKDHVQSQIEVNKENSCRENGAKPNIPESVKSSPKLPSSDSSHFLQSLQVSTSTMESSEPAPASREDQVKRGSVGLSEAMQAVQAGLASESDNSRSDEAQTVSASHTSCLSKLDLPPALKRDLTKHISSKTKPGGHEPNLNIARRVRNLSESRRSDTEKDSGLRPTVRQLISSSGSRRNVNWEQVYQEVRKKQDKGKGMPRFGIEMVPCDQEDQSQEEDDIALLEGFQWESLIDISTPAGSRKRSLSESSVAPASIQSLLQETEQTDRLSSEERKPSIQELEQMLDHRATEPQKQPDTARSEPAVALQRADSMLGDSSSGTEQLDGQGAVKRRRAAGDVVQSPETSGLEQDKKRRKTKSKKERFHIDQLLAVSLREEELSRSLQSVDTSLIQARAALQAAYMEVQRVMVMKEQISTEMSTLRNKRIDLLKGMQGNFGEAPQINLKEESMDVLEAEPRILTSVPQPSATDAAAFPSSGPSAQRAPPPSFMAVVVKDEPKSPVRVCSDLDQNTPPCGESVLLAASRPDITLDFQPPSSKVNPELNQATEEQESVGEPADSKESLLGLVETKKCSFHTEVSAQRLTASCSRRGSEVGSLAECSASQSFESLLVPSALNVSASPSELRSGKRVRKLKKRKVLRKSQGMAPPESSDTELDAEASRPRWLRARRRPSGGSQGVPEVDDAEVIPLDSEDSMEITAACQQTHVPSHLHALQLPHSSRTDPHSLACNEVTSTSDMDVCKSSESEIPLRNLKASTDGSSDHGQDDIPTEGTFEGHQEAVNAMQIHNGLLYTCSGDRTVKAFDLVSHKCVGVFEGHSSKVSCLLVSVAPSLHHRLYSGSSDQTIRCYSLKTQEFEQQFSLPDRVLCLHSRWRILYAGLANGAVVTFNLKTNREMDVFECHGPRGVSCLASSQEGARRILLVGSYDSTISVRDAKNGLLLRTLEGHTKTVLCMKVVNDLVFSGSSDQCVYTHNIHTGELVRVYKGHSHAVTVVTVLGKVMVTACLDKLVRVYDLQSREQLQVYGGHKDMVMCMAVNKNMIYTGCYDGSVQAVKLNLMQNYRCWWHGCPMVLGVMEHLQQHLINDHAATNVQKCRWKDCEEFFCTRNSTKQALILHMQKHAEEEAELEP